VLVGLRRKPLVALAAPRPLSRRVEAVSARDGPGDGDRSCDVLGWPARVADVFDAGQHDLPDRVLEIRLGADAQDTRMAGITLRTAREPRPSGARQEDVEDGEPM
jgi:hypothetical protein